MNRALEGFDGSEGESIYRFVNPRAARKAREKKQEPSLLVRAVLHFTKGSALMGIMSVFYSYVGKSSPTIRCRPVAHSLVPAAATFVSPLGRTLFRALRPAGGRRRGAENTGSVSQLVIVVVSLAFALCVSRALTWPRCSSSSSGSSSPSGRSTVA